jgi:hypothetical protein
MEHVFEYSVAQGSRFRGDASGQELVEISSGSWDVLQSVGHVDMGKPPFLKLDDAYGVASQPKKLGHLSTNRRDAVLEHTADNVRPIRSILTGPQLRDNLWPVWVRSQSGEQCDVAKRTPESKGIRDMACTPRGRMRKARGKSNILRWVVGIFRTILAIFSTFVQVLIQTNI